MLFVVANQLAQQSPHPQDKARSDNRPALIAPGMAQHHLGRTERRGKVMRGQADTEFRTRYAQRAQHCRRQQCIWAWPRGPASLSEPATDHQIRPAHPRLKQTVERNPGMPAPRWADCDPVHRIAQHGGQIARIYRSSNLARGLAQLLDKSGQRAAIRPGPQR